MEVRLCPLLPPAWARPRVKGIEWASVMERPEAWNTVRADPSQLSRELTADLGRGDALSRAPQRGCPAWGWEDGAGGMLHREMSHHELGGAVRPRPPPPMQGDKHVWV